MKFDSIKLLADENISPKVVSFFREHGLDVLDVKEQQWFGKDDEELLDQAYLQNRFVLTHDADFGTLAINEGKPYYGIFYFRLRNLKPDNVIRVCERLLSLDIELIKGTIIVVEEARIRLRRSDAGT
jgi:predicted nuclease of predicted toxin-antitoxin system